MSTFKRPFILVSSSIFHSGQKKKKKVFVKVYVADSEMSGTQKYFFQGTHSVVYKLSACMSYKHVTDFTQQIFTKH